MTAITLDHLTGGRFRLGLGMSGPQVVEGWHGVHYGKPLARSREYVEIIRAILLSPLRTDVFWPSLERGFARAGKDGEGSTLPCW